MQKTSDPKPELSPLSEAEIQWRDKQFKAAQIIARRYTGDCEDLPSLAMLDEVVEGWLDDNESRIEVNVLINAIGIAFGQHLANSSALTWVIATDTRGSDLALYRENSEVLIYPANAVAKRIVAEERRFVESLHSAMTSDIGPG